MNGKSKQRPRQIAASVGLLTLAVPYVVVASEFLSVENAQHAAFKQADRFESVDLALTPQQLNAIATSAGPQAAHGKLRVWRALQGEQALGYFFVDEVIGRQDFITYSLAIDLDGKLSTVEILAYRESHGGEIKNSAWRKQFAGRSDLAALRFATDIKNIAGATMSCEHVTQGVRRIVALWQTALRTG